MAAFSLSSVKGDTVDITLLEDERLDAVNENINLISKKNGLIFGTDAYLLAAYVRPRPSARAAELGAGTGIISMLLASRARLGHITAIEIQHEFAELTKRNVLLNGLSDKISVIEDDVRNAKPTCDYDVVFTNPPYMRIDSGKRNESDEKYIARHEVCGSIDDFCLSASKLLKHGGRFYCVYRPDRLSDLFTAMAKNHLEPKEMTFVHADTDSEPSMVLVSATKYGAPSMRVPPPLFLHETKADNAKARELSPRAQKIYDTMSFYV